MKKSPLIRFLLLLTGLILGLTQIALADINSGYIPEERIRKHNDDNNTASEVFGPDDREIIEDTQYYPYCAVAYMEMHYSCGCEGTGTGFMVERNKLMTAAHCMVCTDHSAWADDIKFYFGYKDTWNFTYVYAGEWYAFVGNTFPNKKYTTDNDWAVVKFYENVGDIVGWFGFYSEMPNDQLTNEYLDLLGYKWGTLRLSYGHATIGSGNLINYQMDMEHGNSGGPVFYLDKEGVPYAVAINIADNDKSNYGYRITKDVYAHFMELDNH